MNWIQLTFFSHQKKRIALFSFSHWRILILFYNQKPSFHIRNSVQLIAFQVYSIYPRQIVYVSDFWAYVLHIRKKKANIEKEGNEKVELDLCFKTWTSFVKDFRFEGFWTQLWKLKGWLSQWTKKLLLENLMHLDNRTLIQH